MTAGIMSVGLPQGVRREQLMELVERLAKELGLSHATLAYLRALARTTRHTDWTDREGAGPRCYRRQTDLATEIGVEPRSARRIERLLERIGFITVKRLDNNHRSGRSGVMGETGVFLAPLIAQFPRLEEMRHVQLEAERRLTAAHAQASVARADLRQCLRDCEALRTHPAVLEASEALEASPARLSLLKDVKELEAITEALSAALSALEEAVGSGGPEEADPAEDETGEITSKTMSGKSFESCAQDSGVLPHIHNTSNPKNVTCMKRAAVPADDPFNEEGLENKPETRSQRVNPNNAPGGENGGQDDGEENDPRADLDASEAYRIPIASLYRAASDEFRMYVDAKSNGWATFSNFVFAAEMRRRELRIRDAAWNAAECLGYVDRAIAVLVLDVNQNHPETPVKNPGGALMGMVKKAGGEDLHLAASVIGILERSA